MTNSKTEVATVTEVVTPWQAAKIVNARLTEEGFKVVPPQMLYNYTTARLNAGKVPFIAYTRESGIDLESLQVWLDKYVAKKKLG